MDVLLFQTPLDQQDAQWGSGTRQEAFWRWPLETGNRGLGPLPCRLAALLPDCHCGLVGPRGHADVEGTRWLKDLCLKASVFLELIKSVLDDSLPAPIFCSGTCLFPTTLIYEASFWQNEEGLSLRNWLARGRGHIWPNKSGMVLPTNLFTYD